MYAGVSEAEKNVRERGRDKGSISVPHNRVTDRQTRLQTFIENPDGCMFFGHSNSVV